jgi:RHS repeat-associated protein
VFWVHEDPITKSKRVTDVNGNVVSSIELDPWGADTTRSNAAAFQPKKFTSYDRDANGTDEAMFRRYNRKHSRFDQPDPSDGSYDLSNPQSFNRYAYVQNDPVNFVDPNGLLLVPVYGKFCVDIGDGHPTCDYSITGYVYFPEPGGGPTGYGPGGPGGDPGDSGGPSGPGGGPGGRDPQTPTPTTTPQDDCHRFADLVQGIANRTNSDTEFLDELARTFTSANNSSIREMRDNSGGPVNPPRISLGDSGFKRQFQDGGPQVRHFVGGFIAGANLGIPGLLFMNSREEPNTNGQNNPDIRLNGVSTNLGAWFTGQPSSLEFRRARLAAQIREDVCQ